MTIEQEIDKKLNIQFNTTTYKNVSKSLQEQGYIPDESIMNQDIVKLPNQSNSSMEQFVEIIKEFIKTENIFKLGFIPKGIAGHDTLLATLSDMGNIPVKWLNKKRYYFMKQLRHNAFIDYGAIDGQKAEQVKEMASSFIQYNSMLEFNKSRVLAREEQTEKTRLGLTNPLKKIKR